MEFFVQYQNKCTQKGVKKLFVDCDENKSNLKSLITNNDVVFGYCSFTYENWRADAKSFPKESLDKPLDNWPGEKWLNYHPKLEGIYKKRIDKMVKLGVYGVDFDNVETADRSKGLKSFIINMCDYAVSKGLLVSLRSYHSGYVPDFFLAEELISHKTLKKYSKYKDSMIFNLEYTPVKAANGCLTAITNLSLDGKKWKII